MMEWSTNDNELHKYLYKKGFCPKYCTMEIFPGFPEWFYTDSPKLRECIDNYIKIRILALRVECCLEKLAHEGVLPSEVGTLSTLMEHLNMELGRQAPQEGGISQ